MSLGGLYPALLPLRSDVGWTASRPKASHGDPPAVMPGNYMVRFSAPADLRFAASGLLSIRRQGIHINSYYPRDSRLPGINALYYAADAPRSIVLIDELYNPEGRLVLYGAGFIQEGTTVHEVAHLWFYNLVGSEGSRNPIWTRPSPSTPPGSISAPSGASGEAIPSTPPGEPLGPDTPAAGEDCSPVLPGRPESCRIGAA